jgi:hypothetical protein
MKPPRRSKMQARIMAGQRSQFPAIGRFVQREKNDGELLSLPNRLSRGCKRVHVVCGQWGCRSPRRGRSAHRLCGCGCALLPG